jgi:hypothetical protein
MRAVSLAVSTPTLQVIRRASFKAVPWKNGGGITHEALRVPEQGDAFRWRVSVAEVGTSGPFSDFNGYRRYMTLLEGAGIDLRFGDGTSQTLRRPGELIEFDGAMSIYGELIDGPCRDLNLIVSKGLSATVRVERAAAQLSIEAGRDQTVLVFPIDGGAALRIEGDRNVETLALERWDLAVLSAGAANVEVRRAGGAIAVFVATLGMT